MGLPFNNAIITNVQIINFDFDIYLENIGC